MVRHCSKTGKPLAVYISVLLVFTAFLAIERNRRSSNAAGKDLKRTDGNHSRIIILETSGSGQIKLRFMGSVESAARHNPRKEILVYLLSDGPANATQAMQEVADAYPNVNYVRLTPEQAFNNSPLYNWFNRDLPNSLYRKEHMSDALRTLLLWKFGGIYFDLDVIVQKELELPANVLFIDTALPVLINNAVMAFQRGHPFLLSVMETIGSGLYTGTIYWEIGPMLLWNKLYADKVRHEDMVVYDQGSPVYQPPLGHRPCPFVSSCTEVFRNTTKHAPLVHWVNSANRGAINTSERSAYMVLLQENAPIVHSRMLKERTVA